MLEKRSCILCSSVFQPKNSNQTVCSGEHYFICPICGDKYKASSYHINNYLKNNIIGCCSTKCRHEQMVKTKIEKYGKGNNGEKISNSLKNKTKEERQQITQKSKQTKLERYGNENYVNTNKVKQTKLERYGNENYNNIDKIKQTNLAKYGVTNAYQKDSVKNKIKQTNLKRYGVDNIFKSKIAQQNIKQKQIDIYGGLGMGSSIIRSKIEDTNIRRYGSKSTWGNKLVRIKVNKTTQNRYGYLYYKQMNTDINVLGIIKDKISIIKYIESLPEECKNMDFISKDLRYAL